MNVYKTKRYAKTISFLEKVASPPLKILDLGTENQFSKVMRNKGYEVYNTKGEDLDINYQVVNDYQVDMVTSFEVFEHMLAPFNILREIKCGKLVASIPLKLWFANAYWNEKDDWDKHYHEFEPKQFDFLLRKTGWKIVASEKWTSANPWKLGIRPFLRNFVPRYYIVYCEKI
jgi:hypothetical protein